MDHDDDRSDASLVFGNAAEERTTLHSWRSTLIELLFIPDDLQHSCAGTTVGRYRYRYDTLKRDVNSSNFRLGYEPIGDRLLLPLAWLESATVGIVAYSVVVAWTGQGILNHSSSSSTPVLCFTFWRDQRSSKFIDYVTAPAAQAPL